MENIEKVKALAAIMKESGLGYIKYECDEFEVEMGEKKPAMPPMPPMPPQAPMAPVAMPVAPAGVPAEQAAPVSAPQILSGKVVKSPIVGTFYAAPAPDKAPYVSVGKNVAKGDVLFIIESMKLMNEVTSEYDGRIAEILVKDGEAVEFDQPIMRIE